MLKFGPFHASVVLEHVAKGSGAVKKGKHGPPVALIQAALIDLGYKLPKSTRISGKPDGIFGFETETAVSDFQRAVGVAVSGIADKHTIVALDAKMFAKTTPPPHVLPVVPPAPLTDQYQLGAADPVVKADPGAGLWNSTPKMATYIALKAAILDHLLEASIVIGYDAAKHMAHYLGNSGKPYDIDLERMIEQVPSAKEAFQDEAGQAQEFVELLPVGTHRITSRVAEPGYNTKEENWNWFYAIGGYSSWGKGEATVSDGPKGRQYALDFEYKFFDRYNWDKGKHVTIFRIKITDEFMGEFHRQGLAQEFDCHGSIKRRFTWQAGQAIPPSQFARPSGRS